MGTAKEIKAAVDNCGRHNIYHIGDAKNASKRMNLVEVSSFDLNIMVLLDEMAVREALISKLCG